MTLLRFAPFACIVILVLASAVGVLPDQSTNAADISKETLLTRVYRTADLPIWNEKGSGFDHSILIALLKANIGEEDWNDDHSISPYPQNVSLVISTNTENHATIVKTLEGLRVGQSKRSPELKHSVK